MRNKLLTFVPSRPGTVILLTDKDQGQDHAPLSVADHGELSLVIGEYLVKNSR